MLALAVASLCHDIAHPGLNNFYHVNARTPLALLYNNKAVLENFHATATFCILMRPEFNFVSSFNQHEFKSILFFSFFPDFKPEPKKKKKSSTTIIISF